MEATTAYLLIACAFLLGWVLGRARPAEALPPPAPPDPDALASVRPILERDGRIAAIRAYRERTGVGLRDAKAAVDGLS